MKKAGIRYLIVKQLFISACILAVVDLSAVAGDTTETSQGKTVSKRRPIIVMKQEKIQGRAFIISDKEGEKQFIEGLKVQMYTTDGKKMICRTATDKDGSFTLENIRSGLFLLKIGLLVVELKVEDPLDKVSNMTSIPKTIAVFIPKELEDLE